MRAFSNLQIQLVSFRGFSSSWFLVESHFYAVVFSLTTVASPPGLERHAWK